MKKQFLFFLFALLPMLAMADDSGSCGTNVTYTYVSSTHTLTIQGTGAMYDYNSISSSVPWNSYKGDIITIVIEDGVTSIGEWAFWGCSGMTSVTIPNSVKSIGNGAFNGCSGLASIEIPNSVTSIGGSAFSGCSGLTSITIPNSVTSIGSAAFENCSGLTSITIPNSVTSIGYRPFSGCSGLTSIIVGTNNTVYDSRNNCNAIIEKSSNTLIAGCKNTEIPNSVTSIGNGAFNGCSGLTSITIPNSVTSIGSEAFLDCSGLTSITIPNSVTSIGEDAFYNCSGLTSIDIPNSVTSIGSAAFYDCYRLSSVTIPNSVTSIGSYAFQECSGLTSVTIGSGVTSIGSYAFDGCSGLTSITIPNSVTSIGNSTFSGCSGLSSITIPNSVTSIGEYAFESCSGLTLVECNIGKAFNISSNTFSSDTYNNAELRVPRDLSSMYQQAEGWKNFKSITEGNVGVCGNNLTYTYSEALGKLTIQGTGAMYDYSSSSSAPWNSYKGDIMTIVIEDGATSVGSYAFYGCSNLYSVTFGKDVKTVGSSAFYGCSIKKVIALDNVTSIGSSAFRDCEGLTSVTIGSGVTSIGEYAFHNCSGLTSVTINSNAILSKAYTSSSNLSNIFGGQVKQYIIGNSVTSIGSYAFSGCSGLTSVTIGSGVTSIGSDAFSGCSGLTSVTIPNSVTSIGSEAFNGCSGLKKVIVPDIAAWCGIDFGNETANPLYYARHLYSDKSTEITALVIPDGVTSIGALAFYGCSGLTSVTIPNSVTSIGNYAFYRCSGLNSVTIGSGVTSIGEGAFYNCSGLTSVTIPNSVTSIGDYALSYCSGLTSVTIGSGVTSIGECAFDHCSRLTSIDIPNSVTSIGDYALRYCSGLTSVTIPNSVTSIGQNAFYNCEGLTSVTIGSGVTSIGRSVFYYCSKLTSVTINSDAILSKTYTPSSSLSDIFGGQVRQYIIGNSVTSIGGYAFYGCSGLTFVTIGSGVTSIESYAFLGCSDLTSVTIGSGVTSIGEGAFFNCSGLKKVIVPDIAAWCGIEFGDETANPLCRAHHLYSDKSTEITELVIPDGVTSIGKLAFYGCIWLTSITIPNSVTSIGSDAFNGCSGLTSVTIGTGVTSIGQNAFSGCSKLASVKFHCNNVGTWFSGKSSIKEVWIEKEVTSIAQQSFAGCSGLKSVYNNAKDVFTIPKNTFDDATYSSAKLYVPTGMKATYEETPWWLNFNKMEEYDFPTPEPSSDNALAISNAETYAGKQIVLPIDMNNVASIKAFQFDLYLPEGVTVAKDGDNEYMVELTSRAAKLHSISAQTRPDGAIRMICTSMSGATFKGNEGAIVNVTLDVAPSMTDGDYDIEVKNIELSDGTPYNPADIKATLTVKTYTPGDVDGTGTVSVNDAVCIINYILGSPIEGFIEAAADLDGNGVITVNDVVILINDYILGGNSQNSLDLAFLQDVTADDDYLYIEEDNLSNMTAGEEREIEVFMNTSRTDIQGLQCDIYLPDGMEFVPEEDGDEKYYADKGGRAAKSHSVASQLMADGSVRVVETSTSGAKFKANELAVFYFTVRATANTAYGQGIRLCNMELSYGGAPINPEDRTFDVKVNAGTVSLNSEGYATFSHASDVEVEGAEVYTATRNGNIISCTKEEQSVAAFNGVILKGEPDATVTLYTNNGVEGYTGNELKPTTTAAGVADIETALVLSGNMFKNYTGAAFDADKAYMPYDGNSANAIGIVFNGATAIDGIASENNLLDGAVIKTVEDGKLVIKTANGKYSSVGAKMK